MNKQCQQQAQQKKSDANERSAEMKQQFEAISINKSKFNLNSIKIQEQYDELRRIDSDFKPKPIFKQKEEKVIQERIDHKEIFQYNHEENLLVLTEQNKKYLSVSQRKGPFKPNIKKSLKQLKKQFNKPPGSLCLSYNKYIPQQIQAILHSNKDYYDQQNRITQLTSLFLSWVKLQKIIHFLCFKRFESLKTLNIGGNAVHTLQMLCRVQLPVVQEMFLWNNNICEIRSLRRVFWPNLRVLDLHVNRIQQVRQLRYIGNKKIQNIILDSNNLSNFNQIIVTCSRSKNSKISLMTNRIVKYMGRPPLRRRKKAIQISPCSMKVRYI